MSEALPANETCARCGGPFRCGMGDAGPCACTTVTLSPATLARLRGQFSGCLCLACLAAEAAADAGAVKDPRAIQSAAAATRG
ncbi:hypothetical protein BurJ1DRAFT_4848 [Burkholderiales bacterium JOSHI_001]|nr:hypothetical protein BurJ1DRAFT_4848 [Burkholderiales bacterium JOSHI_001]